METVYNATDWIFYIVLSIAVIFGVISGFMFMTSAGDPTKTQKARDLLMYMAIGLVVAALAKVIPAIVRTMVGV
jgi:ABC-type bacteriocin/lantibiotic exporter with double-glycine peptidase domain